MLNNFRADFVIVRINLLYIGLPPNSCSFFSGLPPWKVWHTTKIIYSEITYYYQYKYGSYLKPLFPSLLAAPCNYVISACSLTRYKKNHLLSIKQIKLSTKILYFVFSKGTD